MFDKVKKVVKTVFSVIGIVGVLGLVIYAMVMNKKKVKANTDLLTEKINDLTGKKKAIDVENDKLKDDLEDMEKKEEQIKEEIVKLDKVKPKKTKKLTPDEMLEAFREKEKKIFGNN